MDPTIARRAAGDQPPPYHWMMPHDEPHPEHCRHAASARAISLSILLRILENEAAVQLNG